MDREKVIKELESLRDICNAKSNMAIGNGKVAWAGYANAAEGAFALLKEQDAEVTDRQKKVEFIESYIKIGDGNYEWNDNHGELIRCKDCVHWDKGHTEDCENSDSVCFHNGWCKPDFFCADGERKEGR